MTKSDLLPNKDAGLQLKVTMTFGLVEYNTKLRLDENINIADERLYIGKEKGRDRIIY